MMDPIYSTNETMRDQARTDEPMASSVPDDVAEICSEIRTQYETLERFLIDLAAGGGVNMFGSPTYLSEEFGLSDANAKTIVSYWMDSFQSAIIEV